MGPTCGTSETKDPLQFQIFHGMSVNSTRIYIGRFLRGGPMNGEEPRYNLLSPPCSPLVTAVQTSWCIYMPFQTSLMMSYGITMATVFMMNWMTRSLLFRSPSFPEKSGTDLKVASKKGETAPAIRRQRLIRSFSGPSMSVTPTLGVNFMRNACIIRKIGCLDISGVLVFYIISGTLHEPKMLIPFNI